MIVQVGHEASVSLIQKLSQMQESGELCDFTIVVAGSEVRAHKCILAACCDYFKTSFSFGESSQSLTQTDLTHLGCDVKAVGKVIRSFYTNEIDLEPNNLESILQLVDYFMCESLRVCVEMFMENTLTFHTAVMYFQLAIQYQLNSTGLFSSVKRLLYFRFHDYFVYQSDALESSLDIVTAYMNYGIFGHCNPLQLVEFMLKSVKNTIQKLQDYEAQVHMDISKEAFEKMDVTFQMLSALLERVKPGVLEKWKPRLVSYLNTWKKSSPCEDKRFAGLFCHVQALEAELSNREFSLDSMCSVKDSCHVCYPKLLIAKNLKKQPKSMLNIACTNPNCQSKNDPTMQSSDAGALLARSDEFQAGDETCRARGDCCACAPIPVQDYHLSLKTSDEEVEKLFSHPKSDKPAASGSLTIQGEPRTLSLTSRVGGQTFHWAPQEVQVPQIGMADESSRCVNVDTSILHDLPSSAESWLKPGASADSFPRVLLKSQRPDVQEHSCNILVVLAPSAQMAAQLMAVDDGQARPLLRSPKLELSFYDIEMNTWYRGCQLDLPIQGAMLEKHSWRIAYLDSCLYMFSLGREVGLQYNIVENKWTKLSCQDLFAAHSSNAPVKSVIPIKVGKKLIVLSMSREAKLDGTFWTQQHYYEVDPVSMTFERVASVRDERMNMPITQWTVSGDILITVKASTMMYRNLSRVQYIHIYNSVTRELETHEIVCAMEAGVKVLMRDQTVYLLDREGWCRSYDLQTSTWTSLKSYMHTSVSSPVVSHGDEPLYPALTRVTCHAGSSRWEITTSCKTVNACMKETVVNDGGELSTVFHPPPPFQVMTAMCPSTMLGAELERMEQPQFVHVDI